MQISNGFPPGGEKVGSREMSGREVGGGRRGQEGSDRQKHGQCCCSCWMFNIPSTA